MTTTHHPLYDDFHPDWQQLRDCYRGQRQVKERRFQYLPPTSGMMEDNADKLGTRGEAEYAAYLMRARYPEVVRDAVEAMIGVMHHKPPTVNLPKQLEPLIERATLRNESLEALMRRINEEQTLIGRVGLMLDIDEDGPYLSLYAAESVVDWDVTSAGFELPVYVRLDESEYERTDGGSWEWVEKYRILRMNGSTAEVVIERNGTEEIVTPTTKQGTISRVPFQFINSKDITALPDESPLLGLSNLSMSIYRAEADYRQALYMQGQDTLVCVGAKPADDGTPVRVGAQGRIDLNIGGDAKYIGVAGSGLPEMRTSLENDYARAEQRAMALLEATSRSAESGEALRVRVAARTASLNQIALTGAFGLQEILRIAAEWVGANQEDVVIEPNLDFVADKLSGRDMLDYMQAKNIGAPLSMETIHRIAKERGLTDLTWDEEMDLIKKEAADGVFVFSSIDATEGGMDSEPPDEEVDEDEEVEDDAA